MRNGDQPSDLSIKAENPPVCSPGDPHAPQGISTPNADNVTDAPRDASGIVAGVTTAEKLGAAGPTPGAQADPASPRVGPRSTQVVFLIATIVVLISVVALVTFL